MMFDYESSVLTVPSLFIDEYMTACPSVYPLIYLYSLRRAGNNESVSFAEIAAFFNILESDVHNAWRHWDTAGIVSLKDDGGEVAVTFLPPEQWRKTAAVKPAPVVLHKNPAPAPAGERPHYNVDELTFFRSESKEAAHLFSCAETALGKLLTYHDMNVLFGFYDWLRLPVDVLEFLLGYCADAERRDLRYIEKCALDWADNGIDTVEKAREYVSNFNGEERVLLLTMGSNAGFPTPTQRKYINKWRNEWNMPMPLILEACDRAAVQIGKPKFTYVDKILNAWHKAGATTLESVLAADEAFTKGREVALMPAKTQKQNNSRFANFTQRKNDHAHLENLQRQYNLRAMKG
jgi:DnaD/phage-associated family protein